MYISHVKTNCNRCKGFNMCKRPLLSQKNYFIIIFVYNNKSSEMSITTAHRIEG